MHNPLNTNIVGKEIQMFLVTLNDMMRAGNFESVLSLKFKLLIWKRKGVIFIQEPISEMEISQNFFLYWSRTRGNCKGHPPNAFPIPKNAWRTMQFMEPSALTHYFTAYYEQDELPFSFLETVKVYIGEEFAWFYQ